MTKAVWSAAAAAAVLFVASPVFAQATDTKTLNVSATVSARAKLTRQFGGRCPSPMRILTLTPSIVATPLTVDVKTRTSGASNVTLTVLADGDLVSGFGCDCHRQSELDGCWLSAGTMSQVSAVSFGAWTGSGNHTGLTQTYALANSWAYATGLYAAVVTYTLTAP